MSCKIMDVHHRRSPLVQGGLEIPCEVIGGMEMTDKNLLLLTVINSLSLISIKSQWKESFQMNTRGHEVAS